MPRKSPQGKFILSAGEIGAYTVCPEAWRLASLVKVRSKDSESRRRGHELHEEWAASIDEATTIRRIVRLMILVLVLLILAVYF